MSIFKTMSKVSSFLDASGKQLKIGGYLPDPGDRLDQKYSTGQRRIS